MRPAAPATLWALLLAACTGTGAGIMPPASAAVPAAVPVSAAWFDAALASAPRCVGAGRRVHADFERAAMATCRIDADGHIHAYIQPEDARINPSPWYGLVVAADTAAATRLTLHYQGGRHRYAPWHAVPDTVATRLTPAHVNVAADGSSAVLKLPAASVQMVMAQPPETNAGVLAPFEARVRAGQLVREDAGHSIARRPLAVYHHRPAGARGTVVVITRQHPPETTGPQAFARFTDELLGETPAARQFRSRHALMIVPLANPDGFALGHWRHNLGGTDLNRDWGPFTQPETRALGRAISTAASRAPIVAVIDFHSTQRDVIYAPPPLSRTDLGADVGEAMLGAIAAPLAAADVRIDRAHNPGSGVLKSWALDMFGVGGLTWEVGDTSPTDRTDALAAAAARALMAAANTSANK